MECSKNSVHFQDYPVLNVQYNESVVKENDLAIEVCNAVSSIRRMNNIKNKIPLSQITIYHKDKEFFMDSEILEIIKEETNVKSILFSNEIDSVGKIQIKINFKTCGARFGNKMKEIANEVKNGNYKLSKGKLYVLDSTELTNEEFEAIFLVNEEKSMRSCDNGNIIIKLNLDLSQELIHEGIARDILRNIQIERKNLDLEINKRIKISFFSESEKIINIINEFQDYIKINALIDDIKIYTETPIHENFKIISLKDIVTEDSFELKISII